MTADGRETSGVLSVGCFTGDGVALPSDSGRDSVWTGTGVESEGTDDEALGTGGQVSDEGAGSADTQEKLYQTGIEDNIPAISGVLGLGGIGFLLAGLKRGRKGGNNED